MGYLLFNARHKNLIFVQCKLYTVQCTRMIYERGQCGVSNESHLLLYFGAEISQVFRAIFKRISEEEL